MDICKISDLHYRSKIILILIDQPAPAFQVYFWLPRSVIVHIALNRVFLPESVMEKTTQQCSIRATHTGPGLLNTLTDETLSELTDPGLLPKSIQSISCFSQLLEFPVQGMKPLNLLLIKPILK